MPFENYGRIAHGECIAMTNKMLHRGGGFYKKVVARILSTFFVEVGNYIEKMIKKQKKKETL